MNLFVLNLTPFASHLFYIFMGGSGSITLVGSQLLAYIFLILRKLHNQAKQQQEASRGGSGMQQSEYASSQLQIKLLH